MKPYYQDELATIYHGDCNEIMPFITEQARVVITDPPYGINYKSGHRQVSFDFIEGDEEYPADWLKLASNISTDSGTLYMFCNDRSFEDARMVLYQTGFELKKTLIWDKMSLTGGDLDNYGDRVEFILFGSKRRKPRLRGSRDGNLISIPRVYNHNLRHPAEKPELLMSYLVLKSTDPGELVLDPFMGVGPVLVAAKKLGRRVIGIEKNEQYCEVAANDLRHSHFYGNLTNGFVLTAQAAGLAQG